MGAIRTFLSRLRGLFGGSRRDRELRAEIESHLAEAVEDNVREGMAPNEARRAALARFGGVTQTIEAHRERRRFTFFSALRQDLDYAVRTLVRAPGFTSVVVLTLAMGMGATTAIFSAVKPTLFQPLPYPDQDRVVTIQEIGRNGSVADGTFGMYRWMTERGRVFGEVAVAKAWQPTVTGTDEPERLTAQRVSAGFFKVFGVSPAIGPGFQPSDDVANGPKVAVLGDAVWRRRFSANPQIVGRQITLDDESYTVVGVMPPGFQNAMAPSAELWSLLQYDMSQGRAWGHHLSTLARLLPNIGTSEASQLVDALGQAAITELHPPTYGKGVRFAVISLGEYVTSDVRPMLLAMVVAVMLVLVIACVNVTNLLLARGLRRRAEFVLRTALGAGRGRLIRQLLTEGLLLGALGGVAGLAIAFFGVRVLIDLAPPQLPRKEAVAVDFEVFVFGLVVTTLIGLIVGVLPALQAARSDPHEFLHGSRITTGGHRGFRRVLVTAEIALALVLLVGSGLLLRSLDRLFAVPVGFDASRLLTLRVQTAGPHFAASGATIHFFEQLVESVRRLPGVVDAAFTSQLPLSGDREEYGVRFAPDPNQPDSAPANQGYSSFRYAVSPGYMEVMGLPLRQGRTLEVSDREGAPPVALISESLARLRFGSLEAAIGRRLFIGAVAGAPYTVVGVVGDVKQMSLAATQSEAVYVTPRQWRSEDRAMSLIVRSEGDAMALAPVARSAIWALDANLPIARVESMDRLVAAEGGQRRFALFLFGAFALAALVLAAAGCYGVLASYVGERTHEIGVRSVLGATQSRIVAQVVGQGLTLAGFGVVIGLAVAVLASRALTTLLFGISRLDPLTYVGAATLLILVALVATAVPAGRAARIDPARTLRAQ